MRFNGKLEKWNDDRGFGFIAPLQGGDPVFVHISAFARGDGRPQVGDALTFEVEPAGDGKKRAINIQRAGSGSSRRAAADSRGRRGRTSSAGRLVPAIIVAALAVYAYTQYTGRNQSLELAPPSLTSEGGSASPAARFRCDGRIHCSQMTSCEEAKFFLRSCPGTQMDGDNDGIPCEQQWCTGPFAR